METAIENSQRLWRQKAFPFASFLRNQERGWLYSTPVSKKAYSEPVREEFSRTTMGEIIRRWRANINESFKYETFPGYLDVQLAGLVVPAKEIKKQLKKEGFLSDEEADIFVESIRSAFRMYRQEIERILGTETGRITERHPLIADFTFENDDIIDTITYTTDLLFPRQKEKIRDFIERNREELMTVKVVRRFKVIRRE